MISDITSEQAWAVLTEAHSGGWGGPNGTDHGWAEMWGEWWLDALEAAAIVIRHKANEHDVAVGAIDQLQLPSPQGPVVGPVNLTVEQAKYVLENATPHRAGVLEALSPGKGGRAWIHGQWSLARLEALCVLVRAEAGARAEGVADAWALLEEHRLEREAHDRESETKENSL